jgi:hypothetical protein
MNRNTINILSLYTIGLFCSYKVLNLEKKFINRKSYVNEEISLLKLKIETLKKEILNIKK